MIANVWFHLQEVLDQVKLIYGKINQNGSCLWMGQGELTRNEHEGTSWDDGNILYLDRSTGYMGVYKVGQLCSGTHPRKSTTYILHC